MRATNFAAILFMAGLMTASAETAEYNAVDAAKHVGENATVTDKVGGVHVATGGNIFINLGGVHPNAPFTVFISAKAADQFPGVKDYDGKTIAVTGMITSHKDKPEISVTSASQITVKDAAESSASDSAKAAASASPKKS